MKSFQVLLPAAMRGVVNARAEAGGFKDAAEYLSHLVRLDEARASVRTFEEELAERLRTEPKPLSEEDARRIKREIGERRQQELRDLIAAGIDEADRGEVAPLEIEAIISEGRSRMTASHTRRKRVG